MVLFIFEDVTYILNIVFYDNDFIFYVPHTALIVNFK